jgi:hypothetical protein
VVTLEAFFLLRLRTDYNIVMFLLVVPDGVAQLVARRLADLRCCKVGEGRGPDPMAGYI